MDVAALPPVPGAYLLFIALEQSVTLRIASLRASGGACELRPGCYAYCGSARGPGGLRARLGRHLKRDKAPHWHVDHLTAAGRIVALGLAPGGRECALVESLVRRPGVEVPLAGFGSSDCRRCRAHLLRLGRDSDTEERARSLANGLALVWIGDVGGGGGAP